MSLGVVYPAERHAGHPAFFPVSDGPHGRPSAVDGWSMGPVSSAGVLSPASSSTILSMLVSLRTPDSSMDRKAWLRPVSSAISLWRSELPIRTRWHTRPKSRAQRASRTSTCFQTSGTTWGGGEGVADTCREQALQYGSLLYRLRGRRHHRHRRACRSAVSVADEGEGLLSRPLVSTAVAPARIGILRVSSSTAKASGKRWPASFDIGGTSL